jgi:hypothetical protein
MEQLLNRGPPEVAGGCQELYSHLLTIYFLKAGQGTDFVHWVKQVLSATG